MANQPVNALGTEQVREMFKELKDNRTVKPEFIKFLSDKVIIGGGCGVEEFMAAVPPNEAVVIRFFRKIDKVQPNKLTQ